ncbi:NAD(P)/FAD-dependent oxidoreductase [Aestuariimicrobium soli]|uniref:NAD(P)/FAD-dependent oxidoreductase n=1 Tax=Aestuariimicrobium soli TaxID=2035834 RepID=UPI003EBB8FCB
MSDDLNYDVVVVGGGAAGLSGAMALGRSRRSVLVIDAGEPRNAPADHAHNYLGREGVSPRALVEIGREEVARYGVEVRADRVVGLSGEAGSFAVTTERGRRVSARRILVAGGAVDELPDVPGLAARWGKDALHCPYCHGWEVRDQRLVILGTTPMAGHHGLLFGQLSDDVTLVVFDGVELPEAELEKMSAIGVQIAVGTPQEVVTDGDALVGLRWQDGSVLECDAIVVASKVHARADYLAPLGIEPKPFEMNGIPFGSVIPVEPTGATSVPGIFAAGNITDVAMILIAAAAHGVRVGAWINAELAGEEAAAAVADKRAQIAEQTSREGATPTDPPS